MNKTANKEIKTSKTIRTTIIILVLLFVAVCQIFPFYLKFVRAFQPKSYIEIYGVIELWPQSFNFNNFIKAFEMADLGVGYLNTAIVAVSYVALSCCIVIMVGYVLGKKNFVGKNIVTVALMSSMMVPGEVLLVPNYFLSIQLGMYDSLFALIIPGCVNTFGILLVKQYMNTIPDSVIEAARIDGINEFQLIFKVILPMTLPIMGTYCIITFISVWNDYLWPSIILKSSEHFTLQLKLMTFVPSTSNILNNDYDNTLNAAALILTIIPLILVYIVFQRQLIESVNLSGVK